jgi:hypothetical protein
MGYNWRNDPATDAQRRKLFAMGLDGDRPITKGEASDMIDGITVRMNSGRGGSGCLILVLVLFSGLGSVCLLTYNLLST